MGEIVEEKKLKVKKPKEKKEKLKRGTKETSRKSVKEIEMEEYKSEDKEKLEEAEIKVGDDLVAFKEICNQINVEHSTQHKDKTLIRIQMKEAGRARGKERR